MRVKIIFMSLLFFIFSSDTFSAVINNNNLKRYQQVHFFIQNKTNYPVTITIVGAEGRWSNPVSVNNPIPLNANECYQNTLISKKQSNNYVSFASFDAAQIGNARYNYVIFAENGDSHQKILSEHIFDGMGKIFVGSVTNHCVSNTSDGYADCKLIIKDDDNDIQSLIF